VAEFGHLCLLHINLWLSLAFNTYCAFFNRCAAKLPKLKPAGRQGSLAEQLAA
jgi:hypothetical protein